MPPDDLAVLSGRLEELRLKLRVDGALAAIHHDRNVKKLRRLIELDLVRGREAVAPNGTGPEIGFHIMPVES